MAAPKKKRKSAPKQSKQAAQNAAVDARIQALTTDINRRLDELKLPILPTGQARNKVSSPYRPEVKVRPTSLAYVPQDRAKFCACEYDLGEVARALDTENYVRVSVDKHFALCMKESWSLVGKNPETIDYIKKRLFEFDLATGIPFEFVVREVFRNIILFSNSILVYRRDRDLSSGRPVLKFGKEVDPIAGVFPADPTSFRIRRNRWGEVKQYYQRIEGDKYNQFAEKYFNTEDVLHCVYNRKTGMAWGTPYLVPVLDDIRILRNLEELAHLICHKGAFPLYHYKIGTESMPCIDYEDGTSEVTEVEKQIQSKPVEGVWVTPERHEIAAVDGEAPIRNLDGYIEHFKKRVLAGLNLSAIDVGEGDTANRGTATQMSKSIQYQCKDYHKVGALSFTQFFDDLLEEGGHDITPESRVFMTFPEVDIESQQLVNNHALALYQGNAIDEDEMRKQMGKEPFKEEQHERRHLGMVQLPLLELQRQAQASIKAEQAKATASKNSTTNKNRPKNQSGTKPAAGSRKNDIAEVVRLVVDGAESVLRDPSNFPEDRSILIDAVVEELLAALDARLGASVHGARGLLKAGAAALYSATPSTVGFFLDQCAGPWQEAAGSFLTITGTESVALLASAPAQPETPAVLAISREDVSGVVAPLVDKLHSSLPTPNHVIINNPPAPPPPDRSSFEVHFHTPEQRAPVTNVTMPEQKINIHVDGADIRVEPKIETQVPATVVNITPHIDVAPASVDNHNYVVLPEAKDVPAPIIQNIVNVSPTPIENNVDIYLPTSGPKKIGIVKDGEGKYIASVLPLPPPPTVV